MIPRHKSSQIVIGCALVIVAALGLFVGIALLIRGGIGGQQQATRPDWEAAQRQWDRQQIADYDLTVRVGGRRPAVYRVEVRGGEATSASLDGRQIGQQRLFSVWSVPGMFATLDREFELAAGGSNTRPGAPQEVRMYVQWNEIYGYPESYRRLAVGGDDISWDVTEFAPLADPNSE